MKKLIIITFAACLALAATTAHTQTVPRYLNYQSLLYDDGGNLIQDGPADVSFKITDALGNVLYEERQTPDVVRGAVSVLIGNGLDANGAPTGGIPPSVFLPDNARYLDVQVEGFPPESNLEIVSVPYALYAEKALSVKDESIGSAAIAKKSVTMEHLADGLINELASQMAGGGSLATRTDLTNLQTQYRQLSGASTIGVSGNFVYSGNNNVTGVLLDIDRAVQMRQSNINVETTARQTAVTNETNTRSAADTTLQTNINTVVETIGGGSALVPIGSIIPFYDFGGAATFDSRYWRYCDGSIYDFGGAIGVRQLPDLSGRYLVGFGTDGGGDLDTADWATDPVGNPSHQVNLQHSHNVNAHTHDMGNHTHTGPSHSHSVPTHYHGKGTIAIDGSGGHSHTFKMGGGAGAFIIPDYIINNGNNYDQTVSTNDEAHTHANNFFSGLVGNTGGVNGDVVMATGVEGAGTTSVPSTNSTGSNGSTTDNNLSTTQSIQPRSIRVRYIMRVR